MTALPIALVPVVSARRAPSTARNIATVARRELRDAVRTRWFWLYTLAFASLGLAVSFVSAAGAGGAGLSGFGRTTAGLTNLVLLVVPLMALTAGASSIASDRERGMLAYILAQPITRTELLLGKYVGLGGALFGCIALGIGACSIIMAWMGAPSSPVAMLWMSGLALLLALAMLSLGFLISVLARRSSVAVGTAIFVWLTLAFGTDLALMGGAIALRLRVQSLLALSLVNPLQVFKLWSLHAIEASLDVLGPAGLYATEEYGRGLHLIFGACMGAWIAAPLVLAALLFSRRSPL
ncbi:MAG TPA: ABC transporter permease [Phycisphaerales bacterium]|nr:ABC transporter permease [Phycisphaerales bacterium]